MMFFQHFLVLSILLLSLTRSEKDQLSNKLMSTQTENYSTNMFLNVSYGQYNSYSLLKRDAIYNYNESTVKRQNSTESNTEKFNENIVVSSKLDKIYSFVNWIGKQKNLDFQFLYVDTGSLTVPLPCNSRPIQNFNYKILSTNLCYNDQTLNCSKVYPIMYFAHSSLKSLENNHCDQQKTRALEIAAIKFIRLFNKSLQQENTCNQFEKICINDLRIFIESQKGTNLNVGVSWNHLIKDLNLDLIKIDDSLSPCLFVARYEKLYNILRETVLFSFVKPPLCPTKSIACLEGVYTWNRLDQK